MSVFGIWEPIATAPKDGTEILLYCGPAGDPVLAVGHWAKGLNEKYRGISPFTDADFKDGWCCEYGPRESLDWPTHWMPLPMLPEDKRP